MDKYAYIDIETTGLHRKKDNITYVGVFLPHRKKSIIIKDPKENDFKMIKEKTKNLKLIWHNGTFDTSFIESKTGVVLPIHEDSMLMTHLIDSNSPKGLKYLATVELGLPEWDIDLKDKLGQGDDSKLEAYLKKDLENGWLVFKHKQKQLLKLPPRTQKVYTDLMIPATEAIRKIQTNGVYINLGQLQRELEAYNKEYEDIMIDLMLLLPEELKIYDKQDNLTFNFNSTKDLCVLFDLLEFPTPIRTPKGARSTSAEAMYELSKMVNHPILDLILRRRDIVKNLEFLNKWNDMQYESRLYPSFNLCGTKTGRLSSSEPNLQQVPRNIRLRNLFTAPKGSKFVEADFSQVELRIAAHITKDEEMTKAYKQGLDLHTATAMIFNEEPTKEDRTKAKSMNFGLLYGMSANTYRDYAESNYGMILTKREANEIRNNFFKKYKELPRYHKKTEIEVCRKGKLYTEFGRQRLFPDATSNNSMKRGSAVRSAINFPVQSMASDMLVGCLIDLAKIEDIKLVGTVHDSILLEVTKKPQLGIIKETMENPSICEKFNIELSVPIVADVEHGEWGSK
jgi:DNA polymerase I-like protein with 3'-5' exonuclease and polymerase domains